jgi:hypothetical protein
VLVRKRVYTAYNSATEEPWNIPQTALIWHQAIIICFQRWSKVLAVTSLKNYGEVETIAKRRLTTQNTDWYQERIQALVLRQDGKCLACSGDYVEKQWDNSTIKSELYLSEVKIKSLKYMHFKLYFLTDHRKNTNTKTHRNPDKSIVEFNRLVAISFKWYWKFEIVWAVHGRWGRIFVTEAKKKTSISRIRDQFNTDIVQEVYKQRHGGHIKCRGCHTQRLTLIGPMSC